MKEKIDWHICMTCIRLAEFFMWLRIPEIANKITDFSDKIAIKYTSKLDKDEM